MTSMRLCRVVLPTNIGVRCTVDKSALLSSVSPSGRFVAVVRETDAEQTTKNENNKSFSFIEVPYHIAIS